ncbi:MAG TPA: NAD(P)/FAD-dependent oxidoreductase [Myxococcales bacterium]|nr:NAD(P)/FAD-dependent oxidoreductase [Myxococcales bacterium]
MPDAVVIGAGPNGLTAAATLARAGVKTLLLEAQPLPGGAVRTAELTEPGFKHDVGAAFLDWAPVSPGLRALDVAGAGFRWTNAPVDSAHLAPDGTCGILTRDEARLRREMGADGEALAGLLAWRRDLGDRFGEVTLGALPLLGPALAAGPVTMARLGLSMLQSPARWSKRFATPAARRIVPQLALHADTGPDDAGGAAVGLGLALSGLDPGCIVPLGGAGELTAALCKRLAEAGGELRCATGAAKILVRGGAVAAVRTRGGDEIPCRAVLADVTPWALCGGLVDERELPPLLVDGVRLFAHGWGTFKVDWSLDGPVPWTAPSARETAVVHLGGDLPELRAFTAQVRAGQLPEHPFCLVGQQSLFDPSRAPPGKHTLWVYTHVPSTLPGGWDAAREGFADRLADEIERHAPGFRALVRRRAISAPPDLEAMDENLVGGDLGGGTAKLRGQLVFRPAFPYFRYRMGVRGLYLCSASTHPGGGAHGACGYNAARLALTDLG